MTYDQIIINRYKEFLKYHMTENQALYCSRLMFELTAYGFARYISQYFYKIKGYKTKVIDGIGDGGIDIIGEKLILNKLKYIIIQCKKWFYDYIRLGEILTFEKNFEKQKEKYKNYDLYFVTTTWVNKEAKNEAKPNVEIIDCRKLLQIKDEYSLDDFEKDSGKNHFKRWIYKKLFFTKKDVKSIIEQYSKDIYNNKPVRFLTRYNLIDSNKFHQNYYMKV